MWYRIIAETINAEKVLRGSKGYDGIFEEIFIISCKLEKIKRDNNKALNKVITHLNNTLEFYFSSRIKKRIYKFK